MYLSDLQNVYCTDYDYCKFGNFLRGFYLRETSHMRSFVKMKPSQNDEMTLLFTDKGKLCPSHDFLTSQICLYAIHENKILEKISDFTVSVNSSNIRLELQFF